MACSSSPSAGGGERVATQKPALAPEKPTVAPAEQASAPTTDGLLDGLANPPGPDGRHPLLSGNEIEFLQLDASIQAHLPAARAKRLVLATVDRPNPDLVRVCRSSEWADLEPHALDAARAWLNESSAWNAAAKPETWDSTVSPFVEVRVKDPNDSSSAALGGSVQVCTDHQRSRPPQLFQRWLRVDPEFTALRFFLELEGAWLTAIAVGEEDMPGGKLASSGAMFGVIPMTADEGFKRALTERGFTEGLGIQHKQVRDRLWVLEQSRVDAGLAVSIELSPPGWVAPKPDPKP